MSEMHFLTHTRIPSDAQNITFCSVIGGCSLFSLLANESVNPERICLFDYVPEQILVCRVYLALIGKATTYTQFVNMLYGCSNASEFALDNMTSHISELRRDSLPEFDEKELQDFYEYVLQPRICRDQHDEFPTELWPMLV